MALQLTLAQWQALEAQKEKAFGAMNDFENQLCSLLFDVDDKESEKHLSKLLNRAADARQSYATIDVHCVNEWTDGDSSKWREPQSAPLPRNYFDEKGQVRL